MPDVLQKFKNKIPGFKPLKLRFYRNFNHSSNSSNKLHKKESKDVVIIKNLSFTVTKQELQLFLSEFAKPYYIGLPRDQEDNVKGFAYVYFESDADAEKVINYVNMRYIRNRQIIVKYATNFIDLSDFRTRIELGVKIENEEFEKKLLIKQIKCLAEFPTEENMLKINYLKDNYRHILPKDSFIVIDQKSKRDDKEIDTENINKQIEKDNRL